MLSERMFFILFIYYSGWLYSQPTKRRYSQRDGQPDIAIINYCRFIESIMFFISALFSLRLAYRNIELSLIV